MITSMDRKASLERVKRAIFCKNCVHVNVLKADVHCKDDAGECGHVPFGRILDLYANLYYLLDSVNLVEYKSIEHQKDKECLRDLLETRRLWQEHLQAHDLGYNSPSSWDLLPETFELIREHLHSAETNEELLLRMMGWLIVLDQHLDELKQMLESKHLHLMPISTYRGDLLLKRTPHVLRYLESRPGYKPPADPNYLQLRRYIENFHLAKKEYRYYRVRHISPFFPTTFRAERAQEMKIGFLPGKRLLEWDYDMEMGDITQDGNLPFVFTQVKNRDEYYGNVEQCFDNILADDPEFIILPEFFTPIDLQNRMKEKVRRRYLERNLNGEEERLIMLMTGSFHVLKSDVQGPDCENPDWVYNYAQAIEGDGYKLLDLYKMNQFKLEKSPLHNGELARFREYEGVEINAYDQREVTILETPIGRMVIFICVDFINLNIEEILIDRHVDFIFVMSLTPNPAGGKFLRRMQELGERNGAVIVLCNHLGFDEVPETKPENRIVVYFPGFKKLFVAPDEWKVLSIEEMVNCVDSRPLPWWLWYA